MQTALALLLAAAAAPQRPLDVTDWLVAEGGPGCPSAAELVARYPLGDDGPPEAGDRVADSEGVWTRSGPRAGALAHAIVIAEAEHVRMARLSGARTLFVNGEPFFGDPERRGHRGVPVLLREGANELYVEGADGEFELELWKPETRLVLGTWDVRPDALPADIGEWAFMELDVLVLNAAPEPIESMYFEYSDPVPADGRPCPPVTRRSIGEFVAPLCSKLCRAHWTPRFDTPSRSAATHAWVSIDAGSSAQRRQTSACLRLPIATVEHEALRGSRARSHLDRGPSTMVLVYGTLGSPVENSASLSRARFEQQRRSYTSQSSVLVWPDHRYLRHLSASASILDDCTALILGNADTNAAWSVAVGDDPRVSARRGGLTVDGTMCEGTELFGACRVPRHDGGEGEVLLLVDTGPRAALLGAWHDAANADRELDTFYRVDASGALEVVARLDDD